MTLPQIIAVDRIACPDSEPEQAQQAGKTDEESGQQDSNAEAAHQQEPAQHGSQQANSNYAQQAQHGQQESKDDVPHQQEPAQRGGQQASLNNAQQAQHGQEPQQQPLCLLSTSMDRTMMLWRPDPATGTSSQISNTPKQAQHAEHAQQPPLNFKQLQACL